MKRGIAVLVDFENLLLNMELGKPEQFSLLGNFHRLIRQISQEAGEEIAFVLVFAPPHLTATWAEDFFRLGFFSVYCPRIISEDGTDKDTVDETIIEVGRRLIVGGQISHICLCSGDNDFVPFLQELVQKGIKIIIVAGNLSSLSVKLIRLAEKKRTGEKMVYILSPTKK